MFYSSVKKVLRDKTVWVVGEEGEWYYSALAVCFTKAEAEQFIADYKGKRVGYGYRIDELRLGEALDKFDEETKSKTIKTESEKIAEEGNDRLRTQIIREMREKYTKALQPIEEELNKIVERGFW
jgi:hypothetical protein